MIIDEGGVSEEGVALGVPYTLAKVIHAQVLALWYETCCIKGGRLCGSTGIRRSRLLEALLALLCLYAHVDWSFFVRLKHHV